MEKPVPVKTSKVGSAFALFFAQYVYLQRHFALGFAYKSSFTIEDGMWAANVTNDKIIVQCQYDFELSMNRQSMHLGFLKEIANAERDEAFTRDALSKLEASVKQVDGKRSLLQKIDKAKQPEMYAIEEKKLVELEQALGAYQPFITEYNNIINSCQQRVKDAKESLKNLPVIRESQEWEFTFEELSKITQ
jgi:flagellar biosynthesis chaperone FliJ